MNIHVSNLSKGIKDNDLANLFSAYGEVKTATVVNDSFTGQSRGFGYVEIEDEAAAQKAIEGLNNSEVESLVISVQEAKPKEEQKGSYKVGNGAINVYRFRKN
jgi:RNA recognition motif-containing protein